MTNFFNLVEKRYSVRNYSKRAIEPHKMAELKDYMATQVKGPLGSTVRFEIVDGTGYSAEDLKEFGVYGMLKGVEVFIAGAVLEGPYAMEDFGFCLENIILKATELGLGTCWLGGSLSRSTFAEKIRLGDKELIPAVSSLGFAEEKRTLTDRVGRTVMRASKRKPFGKLFFSSKVSQPLDQSSLGEYAKALEAVRQAPSAANFQPWRVIHKDQSFHFFLEEKIWYNNMKSFEKSRLQNIDMGIALSHFQLAADSLGLKGEWKVQEPDLEKGKLQYIVSWEG